MDEAEKVVLSLLYERVSENMNRWKQGKVDHDKAEPWRELEALCNESEHDSKHAWIHVGIVLELG